jgi:cytochrome c peroxidase
MKKMVLSRKNFLNMAVIICCLTIVFVTACKKEELVVNGPGAVPKLPSVRYHYANMDDSLATLGRVLFYDHNLSLNNAISCGSCHIQAHSFADNKALSIGLNNQPGTRNASTIINTGFNHSHFWDGRAADFDTAVFMPVENHGEMDIFNMNLLPAKLSNLSYYGALFTSAYGTKEITLPKIRTALAAFVSDLYSANSRFDTGNLTAEEQNGWNLFTGKAMCYNCHNGNGFNGYGSDYENTGLDVNYVDAGRGKITKLTSDNGKFNVPTLRNIALSAPYMHDGRYTTLRQVIDHYSEGVQNSPNLSWALRAGVTGNNFSNASSLPPVRLNLTEQEKKELEAFLNSLTDLDFVTDPRYANPF